MIGFAAAAAGGAAGALCRYTVSRLVDTDFPWATFIVNLSGCFLASFLMFRFGDSLEDSVRILLFTGFFGAFTTMSAFSVETVSFLTEGEYWLAAGNIALNSIVCIAGAVAGKLLSSL